MHTCYKFGVLTRPLNSEYKQTKGIVFGSLYHLSSVIFVLYVNRRENKGKEMNELGHCSHYSRKIHLSKIQTTESKVLRFRVSKRWIFVSEIYIGIYILNACEQSRTLTHSTTKLNALSRAFINTQSVIALCIPICIARIRMKK